MSKSENENEHKHKHEYKYMSEPFSEKDKKTLNDLVHQFIEHESLSDDQKRTLNDLLRRSPEARSFYDKLMETHLNLQWLIAPQSASLPSGLESLTAEPAMRIQPAKARKAATKSSRKPARRRQRNDSTLHAIWMTAAACVLVGLSIYMMEPEAPLQQTPPDYFARVIYSEKIVKGSAHDTKEEGAWLSSGTVHLEQGTMGLILDSGVEMQLTGPAKLQLRSPEQCFLDYGDISTRVPKPAYGFTLHTPTGSIVDLGTEYAVKATPTESQVQVFEGKVRALTETKTGENLEKIIEKQEAFQIKDAAFNKAELRERNVDWKRFKLKKPEYVAFDLNELSNIQSSEINDKQYQGKLANRFEGDARPVTTSGPFGDAARFQGKGDFIETNFPGIKGKMPRSVSFWVKVPPTLNDYTGKSIVSWGKAAAGQRWQIGICVDPRYGKLGSIRTDFSHGYVTGSTDLRDGQWHFITSVFVGSDDSSKAIDIRHYVDGKLEAVSGYLYRNINTKITNDDQAKDLLIGYWDSWTPRRKNESEATFRGSVDEVKVFNRALYPSQIMELMAYNEFLR